MSTNLVGVTFGIRGCIELEAGVRRQGVALRTTLTLSIPMLLVACSGSGVDTQPPASPPRSPTATAPPGTTAPTIDPRAAPAVVAYQRLNAATNAAREHPLAKGQYPPEADFTKYSFDPFRTELANELQQLAAGGYVYRGTAPQAHPRVKSIALTASPWPKVTLTDCQTTPDWHIYNTKSGARIPDPKVGVRPPYRSTIVMIYYKKHWGIYSFTSDPSATCTP